MNQITKIASLFFFVLGPESGVTSVEPGTAIVTLEGRTYEFDLTRVGCIVGGGNVAFTGLVVDGSNTGLNVGFYTHGDHSKSLEDCERSITWRVAESLPGIGISPVGSRQMGSTGSLEVSGIPWFS